MKKSLILLLSTVLLLSGCNFFKSEKDRFVSATSEALCLIFTSENPMSPSQETSDKVKAIYTKNGFNADDQAAMETITKKYENDQAVKDTTAAALKECSGIDVNNPAPAETAATPATDAAPTTDAPETEVTPATPAVTPAK